MSSDLCFSVAKEMVLHQVKPCAEDPDLIQVDGYATWTNFESCADVLNRHGFVVSAIRNGATLVAQRRRSLIIAGEDGSITFSLFECEQEIATLGNALAAKVIGVKE